MDGDPNGTPGDYRAAVDWGDGSRGNGTVAADAAGGPTVSANHTYAQPGSYTVAVTVTDYGGAQRTTQFTAQVSPRSTATSVACAPSSVTVLLATACTATVSDTQSGASSTPNGTVSFTSGPSGGFSPGACTLTSTATVGRSSCTATYSPNAVGSGTRSISVVYGGDAVHAGSLGSTPITVTAGPTTTVTPKCSISVPSSTLAKHAKRFTVKVRCNAPANVQLTTIVVVRTRRSRDPARLKFGIKSATVAANRTVTLTLRPPSKVLRQLRAAAKEHAKISLTLNLKAINTAAESVASASVGKFKIKT
jgi:hypothetical protein